MRAFPHRNKFIFNTVQAQEYKYIKMWRYRTGMYNVISIVLVGGFCNRALSYRNFYIIFTMRVLYRNMNVIWRYRPGFYMRAFPHRNKFISNTVQAQVYKYIIMWLCLTGMYNITSIIMVSGFYNRALSHRNFFIYHTGTVQEYECNVALPPRILYEGLAAQK